MAAKRNYQHVPFDRMKCPVDGCESGPKGGPQEGTVPGIKRHVLKVHGKAVAKKIEWPPIRKGGTSPKPKAVKKAAAKPAAAKPKTPKPKKNGLSDLSLEELRKVARDRGVKYAGLSKEKLVKTLQLVGK